MTILSSPAELARLCRSLREAAGLTQRELADAIGEKSVQQISNAESEAQPSRLSTRRRILQHFGQEVTEAYLVSPISNKQ